MIIAHRTMPAPAASWNRMLSVVGCTDWSCWMRIHWKASRGFCCAMHSCTFRWSSLLIHRFWQSLEPRTHHHFHDHLICLPFLLPHHPQAHFSPVFFFFFSENVYISSEQASLCMRAHPARHTKISFQVEGSPVYSAPRERQSNPIVTGQGRRMNLT